MKLGNIDKNKLKKIFKRGFVLGILTTSIVTIKYFKPKDTMTFLKRMGITVTSDDYFGRLNERDDDTQFSLFDVGSYQQPIQDEAILKQLADSTLEKGIIINSSAKNLGEIYEDVDYVKKLVQKYSLTYPIFLNIDSFFKQVNAEDSRLIIDAFVKKLNANGCIVVLMGHKANLANLTDKNYNKALITDYATKDHYEDYNMFIINQDIYALGIDYENIIKTNMFNSEAFFTRDETYYVQKGETINDIAEHFSIDANDLIEYNQLVEPVKENQEIILPHRYDDYNNWYNNSIDKTEDIVRSEMLKTDYYVGISVSAKDGSIAWSDIASKINFALIRIGWQTNIDFLFEENMLGCTDNKIPKGLLFASQAKTYDELENELKFLKETLDQYIDIELPIYIDMEGDLSNLDDNRLEKLASDLPSERKKMNDLLRHYCETIEEMGYQAGISLPQESLPFLDKKLQTKYAIRVTGGRYDYEDMSFNGLKFGYDHDIVAPTFRLSQYGLRSALGIVGGDYINIDVMDKTFMDNLIKNNSYQK